MEKWILKNVKSDFKSMSKTYGLSELLCKILVNRRLSETREVEAFIKPKHSDLHNPRMMKDMDKAVDILINKLSEDKKIRVIGDYDVDGVVSTYLLYSALVQCADNADNIDYDIPHRVHDGYGINGPIIDKAIRDGVDTIITCDNGISAIQQIEYAKKQGLTVIVTDHHMAVFTEDTPGVRIPVLPAADAIINVNQPDCLYPFKSLCGAGIALKLVQVLYEEIGIPETELEGYIQFVALATVCDVVDLTGENRNLVKIGLEKINETQNIGLNALLNKTGIKGKKITCYHLGYIIGPSINASGRLDCAKKGLRLLLSDNEKEADVLAEELHKLNIERRKMAEKGVEDVIRIIEGTEIKNNKVLVVYEPSAHESIAGIIAGKIRERYNKPTFIFTSSEHGVKGSGRSIEQYNMFEELLKCKCMLGEDLGKFGGHPMAAGLSLACEDTSLQHEGDLPAIKVVDRFRKHINTIAALTDDDLVPKVNIDAQVYLRSITMRFAEELEILEPYGKGNAKPIFVEKEISIGRITILKSSRNVLKLHIFTEPENQLDCIFFGDSELLLDYIQRKFGQGELEMALGGKSNNIRLDIVFTVGINEYQGNRTVQLIMQHYR